MIDRNELIEEQLLRENIRKAIKIVKSKKEKQPKEDQMFEGCSQDAYEEKLLLLMMLHTRKLESIIFAQHLKKIIPTIKDAYMSLNN